MGLKDTFSTAVEVLFTQFADFVVPATFSSSSVQGFDFSTGSVTETTSSLTLDVIPLTKTTDSPANQPNEKRTVYLKSGQLDPSFYTKITFGGVTHNILSFTDNGFVTKFEVVEDR
jgi:hypothetical protein